MDHVFIPDGLLNLQDRNKPMIGQNLSKHIDFPRMQILIPTVPAPAPNMAQPSNAF